ncbi:MAG: AAA family ATPase [Campylobacterota bacterium]|nr:AAA family ATPase [Campylobacterota bacterium]
MYLKSLKIEHFRKFGEDNNLIEFVDSKDGLQADSINIATATTLIVGKNNSGKTTVTKALDKLIGNKKFEENDFNFFYLNKLLEGYIEDTFENFPTLEFELVIGIDDSDENQDLITNIVPFLTIEDVDTTEFSIKIKYELLEMVEFISKIKSIIDSYPDNEYIRFQKYLEVIKEIPKQLNYYNSSDELIEKSKFKLSDLIQIKIIEANKTISDTSLSDIFNKIIQYKYQTEDMSAINSQIETINTDMTEKVSSTHTAHVNGALHAIENQDKLEMRLSSSLTFDILMKHMIRYEYVEKGLNIPEDQFGLGYSNLMSIIGEIIDYIEQYPAEEFHSKLNIICIEEPEAFMHPQMQELFIKNINDAIKHLLDGSTKKINSQLVVTTHSSHILNSKIHTSNSFDNINYMTIINNLSNVVNLKDKNIINSDSADAINDLKFIKKHMKHKVSELFFSDAIIFVEGITEETLLTYYMDNDDSLNKYYISIFNINGAHGLVYHNLIKLLKIPTLIITDLDIKRTKTEKDEFVQIRDFAEKETTNKTISNYHGSDNISNIPTHFEDENLYITFQSQQIESYYATSLEEAYILKNYNNDLLNIVLKKLKPQIYSDIVGEPENRVNLKDNSYKLQSKLSNSKSDFANELLYQLSIKENDEVPDLPEYIQGAIDWLKVKLTPDEIISEVVL